MTNQSVTNPVSKEDFDKSNQRTDYLFWGVTIVLAVGFISLLITVSGVVIDAYRFKAATYQDLINKIEQQSKKIDMLSTPAQSSPPSKLPKNIFDK